MKKNSFYASLFIVIITFSIYFYKFTKINKSLNENRFTFNIPKITLIKTGDLKNNYLIDNSYVWGSVSAGQIISQGNHTAKGVLKILSGYVYKKIQGIPSICKTTNINYRWELYGIAYKNNSLLAIFYNPYTNKVKLLGKNNALDKDLIIEKIGFDNVYVKYKQKVFILKIFEFSKATRR